MWNGVSGCVGVCRACLWGEEVRRVLAGAAVERGARVYIVTTSQSAWSRAGQQGSRTHEASSSGR